MLVCWYVQIAGYVGELVKGTGLELKLGVVQTAYANGASTDYITQTAVIIIYRWL